MRKRLTLILLVAAAAIAAAPAQTREGGKKEIPSASLTAAAPAQMHSAGQQTITVASWNIGHFALGTASDTRLTHAALDFYLPAYRNLFSRLQADILALVEYNPLLVNATPAKPAVAARDAILSSYRDAQEGPKLGYNCNALFSNGIEAMATDTVIFSRAKEKRYYLASTMRIGGEEVKVVAAHLDWSQGADGAACREAQIKELVDAFADDPYVILCADWNTDSTAEYDAFARAGYHMANHGRLGDIPTWPAGNAPSSCIDNIIAKGFTIADVTVVNSPALSDHCLIMADLTKRSASPR